MSADYGAIMYFDAASLLIGFLTGVTIAVCIFTLVTIWRNRK